MSRIAAAFKPGRKAFIAYLTVGYPDVETTRRAAQTLAESGCDIIELGIPFSDPLADGATIQKASYQALKQGVTPQTCLEAARAIREKTDTPLVFMSYYNPILNRGLDDFCRASNQAGVDGIIIPDLPPEEGAELEASAAKHNLDLIYLLTPTSTGERISQVAQRCRGFIYLVSLTGVTGARQTLPVGLEDLVGRVRRQAKQPVCIGFGVANPEQTKRAAAAADGIIVGSRLIQLIEEDNTLSSLKSLASSLRQALDTI